MHAAVAQSEFESPNVLKSTSVSERFGGLAVQKAHAASVRSTRRKQNVKKRHVRTVFRGRRWIPHLAKNEPNMRFLRHPSNMFRGQRADFLREVAFWSIRSSGSLR